MVNSLRVRSHIIGATLVVPNEKMYQPARDFYHRLFNRGRNASVGGEEYVRHVEASQLATLGLGPPINAFNMFFESSAPRKAMWIPHVAIERQHAIEACRSSQKLFEIVATLSSTHKDPRGVEIVVTNPDLTDGERIPFILVYTDSNDPVFANSSRGAPFPMQPKVEGVVNWADILVTKPSSQRKVAKLLNEAFGWNMARPISMGPNGEYITLFNDTREIANRHKICGMLPKAVLLPKLAEENRAKTCWMGAMVVPFLSCQDKTEFMTKVGMVLKHGGELLLPPMEADGDVAIARDPFGGVFALYNRTDIWDQVKPTTELVKPSNILNAEPMRPAS